MSDRLQPFPESPTPRPDEAGRPLRSLALPLAIFVVVVAGIAWVTLNLPRGGSTSPPPKPDDAGDKAQALLRFARTKVEWDPDDPAYVMEYEPGVEGHADFPFANASDTALTLGFARTSCDCSKLKVALVPDDAKEPFGDALPWTELPQHDTEGVAIPPKANGVVRIHWNGRKGPGERLRLLIKMWVEPQGKSADRSFESLEVPIVMTAAVRFLPTKLTLGQMAPGGVLSGEILAVSSTRKKLDLKLDLKTDDPLFEVKLETLTADEVKTLDKSFRDKAEKERSGTTRLSAAARLSVTIREQAKGVQLDQGLATRTIAASVPDSLFPIEGPVVTAMVRGDVDVGAAEDGGKVVFKPFSARDGAKKSVPLWCEAAGDLVAESVLPRYLDVKLARNVKESVPGRQRWQLDVVVPPGSHIGAFAEDAVVVLRTPTTPPRKVRIPITGAAVN